MARRAAKQVQLSAGVILVDGEGRILLELRQQDDPLYPNRWGIVGGMAEDGESPEQAALREAREETGLELDALHPFKVHEQTLDEGVPCEAHLYFCVIDSTADLTPEGQALRSFRPDELDDLAFAFRDREILADFLTSPEYRAICSGENDALAQFSRALDDGGDWFSALLEAIARWGPREELVDGRRYRYLIGGEAFDWLLLAERLCEEADGAIPHDEREALLFRGRPPRELDGEEFRRAVGSAKHRAHLNYLYGVIIEEALQLATEEDVLKEHRSRVWNAGKSAEGLVFERIYGKAHDELLAAFRQERSLPPGDCLAYTDLKEFTYWLFKYRLHQCDPARVASDTRKALAQLSQLESAARRRGQRLDAAAAEPVVVVDA